MFKKQSKNKNYLKKKNEWKCCEYFEKAFICENKLTCCPTTTTFCKYGLCLQDSNYLFLKNNKNKKTLAQKSLTNSIQIQPNNDQLKNVQDFLRGLLQELNGTLIEEKELKNNEKLIYKFIINFLEYQFDQNKEILADQLNSLYYSINELPRNLLESLYKSLQKSKISLIINQSLNEKKEIFTHLFNEISSDRLIVNQIIKNSNDLFFEKYFIEAGKHIGKLLFLLIRNN